MPEDQRYEEYRTKLGLAVCDAVARIIDSWNINGHTLSPIEKELKARYSEYAVNRMPRDEPFFMLRGQDIHAATTVRFWARQVDVDPTSDQRLVQHAVGVAMEMEKWPVKKHPDMPGERTPGDVFGTAHGHALGSESETTK